MAYAVVTFNDESVSEVPANWLEPSTEEENQCWWPPHSKGVAALIAKRVEPDKLSWRLLTVKIEKWCRAYILYFCDFFEFVTFVLIQFL